MKLVDDWRNMRKWYSTWITGAGFVLSSVAASLALTGAVVPWFAVAKPWEVFGMASVVFLGAFLGRLIKQNGKGNDAD